jgi:hypothetical protein
LKHSLRGESRNREDRFGRRIRVFGILDYDQGAETG